MFIRSNEKPSCRKRKRATAVREIYSKSTTYDFLLMVNSDHGHILTGCERFSQTLGVPRWAFLK